MKIDTIEIDSIPISQIKYSICTLVTNKLEYEEMVASFINAGFDPAFCEYLYIDNSNQNKYDAYSGIAKFLQLAKGKYILLCHQDLIANFDRIEKLERCIEEISHLDPQWGILGNAGGATIKKNVYSIAYPDGKLQNDGPFPVKVKSLDENFLLLKKEANIGISRDLKGFHLYGTDLCIIAGILGFNCYVIDFLLTHKSYGNPDRTFFQLKSEIISKYKRAFQGSFIRTTITTLYISGSSLKSKVYNTKLIIKLVKFYHKAKKQLNIY